MSVEKARQTYRDSTTHGALDAPAHTDAAADTERGPDVPIGRPDADTIIAMAAELPPRTFRVWLDERCGDQ